MLCMGGQGEVGYVNLNSQSGEELSLSLLLSGMCGILD